MADPRGARWARNAGPKWRKVIEGHVCEYPGCGELVNNRVWGCRKHFLAIPVHLRDAYMAAKTDEDKASTSDDIEYWLENEEIE